MKQNVSGCETPPPLYTPRYSGDFSVSWVADHEDVYIRGTRIEYVCDDGYEMSPSNFQLVCGESGSWAQLDFSGTPVCIRSLKFY